MGCSRVHLALTAALCPPGDGGGAAGAPVLRVPPRLGVVQSGPQSAAVQPRLPPAGRRRRVRVAVAARPAAAGAARQPAARCHLAARRAAGAVLAPTGGECGRTPRVRLCGAAGAGPDPTVPSGGHWEPNGPAAPVRPVIFCICCVR